MSTVFFYMSIVVDAPSRKGLSVAYPAVPPRAHRRRRRAHRRRHRAGGGGAWLLPPGDGQVIADTFFSDSSRAFDAQGHLIPVPSYRKFEVGTYIEYGLTNWPTLVASPSYDRIQNPPPGQSYNGGGESEIAARIGLYHTDTSVLSFQAGLRSARRLVRGFAWAVRGAPRRFPRCPGPGRAQRYRRGDGGVRRGTGRLSLLRRRAARRRADRSGHRTPPPAATSRVAAELHVDCKRFPPVRACILDQTATKLRLRYRAAMVGADRRLYNGRGDQRRTRAGSNRWGLV